MDAHEILKLVHEQIDGRWEETNSHGVDLPAAPVTPAQTTMILRSLRKGKTKDSTVEVWIVLQETHDGDGYIIFYDDDRNEFGLAATGHPEDDYPVVCGYYGDFWNAFKGM